MAKHWGSKEGSSDGGSSWLPTDLLNCGRGYDTGRLEAVDNDAAAAGKNLRGGARDCVPSRKNTGQRRARRSRHGHNHLARTENLRRLHSKV